jgi:hypothetical protein
MKKYTIIVKDIKDNNWYIVSTHPIIQEIIKFKPGNIFYTFNTENEAKEFIEKLPCGYEYGTLIIDYNENETRDIVL